MEMSRVTSKYQATVPADARAALGLKAGDQLGWEVEDDGGVRVRRLEERPVDERWLHATLVDSRTFGEWLSEEDEDLFGVL